MIGRAILLAPLELYIAAALGAVAAVGLGVVAVEVVRSKTRVPRPPAPPAA